MFSWRLKNCKQFNNGVISKVEVGVSGGGLKTSAILCTIKHLEMLSIAVDKNPYSIFVTFVCFHISLWFWKWHCLNICWNVISLTYQRPLTGSKGWAQQISKPNILVQCDNSELLLNVSVWNIFQFLLGFVLTLTLLFLHEKGLKSQLWWIF